MAAATVSRAPSAPDLLTYREAAERLGVTVEAVRRAVTLGKLQRIKIPGHITVFLRRQDVENYRNPRREVAASMSDARRAPGADMAPYLAATSADEVHLHELRLKGDMFAGIAQNVATQARLAVQPVANPEQVSAWFTAMLQQAMSAFVAHFGADRLARIMEQKTFTSDDLAAMFAAMQSTVTQLMHEPPTPTDAAAMREVQAVLERYAHASGALGIESAPGAGARE